MLKVGFLIDDLSPSHQVNELIEFVESNEVFDNPALITGYKNTDNDSVLKKVIGKFKQSPIKIFDALLMAVLMKVISRVELKKAKKRFPEYRSNHQIEKLNEFKVISVEGMWSKSGLFLEMTSDDLTLIENCKLDCIIRICSAHKYPTRLLDIFGSLDNYLNLPVLYNVKSSMLENLYDNTISEGILVSCFTYQS